MDTAQAKQPEEVPTEAKTSGATTGEQWGWVEAEVWTSRMLDALETGVKGGKWHSLIDKVYSNRSLHAAYERVAANGGSAGVDHVSVEQFGGNLEDEVTKLQDGLRKQTYQPQAIKRVYIPKAGSDENG